MKLGYAKDWNDLSVDELFLRDLKTEVDLLQDVLSSWEKGEVNDSSIERILRSFSAISGALAVVGFSDVAGAIKQVSSSLWREKKLKASLDKIDTESLKLFIDLFFTLSKKSASSYRFWLKSKVSIFIKCADTFTEVPYDESVDFQSDLIEESYSWKNFSQVIKNQPYELESALLALEENPTIWAELERALHAVHAIRISGEAVGLKAVVDLSSALESCFIAVQENQSEFKQMHFNCLFESVDIFRHVSYFDHTLMQKWEQLHVYKLSHLSKQIRAIFEGNFCERPLTARYITAASPQGALLVEVESDVLVKIIEQTSEVSLSGRVLLRGLEKLKLAENNTGLDQELVGTAKGMYEECLALQKMVLFSQVQAFEEAYRDLPRMVRDLSQETGKVINFSFGNGKCLVDRRLMKKLRIPINNLIRNAIEHGFLVDNDGDTWSLDLSVEILQEQFAIKICDNGIGINVDKLREKLIAIRVLSEKSVSEMSLTELLPYLFYPGLSTLEENEEIMGSGVGLDLVREMVEFLGGKINMEINKGPGVTLWLLLPATKLMQICYKGDLELIHR